MELAPVYDLSAVNQRHFRHFQFLVQRDSMNTISFDAVRHLVLCRIEQRPPRLDLQNWPHLPLPRVRTTAAADYMTLLAGISTPPAPSDMEVA
jgi:hypothetical protein